MKMALLSITLLRQVLRSWQRRAWSSPDKILFKVTKLVGMRILSQVIPASSCEQNWSGSLTHPYEDLQQVRAWNCWKTCLCLLQHQNGSNSRRQRAQDVCLGQWICVALTCALPGQARLAWHPIVRFVPRNYLIVESSNRWGANFAESSNREARPHDSAWFDQPCCSGPEPVEQQSGYCGGNESKAFE